MKNIEYYSEGMCYYKEESNEIMYVNSCQRGYKCVSSDYGTYSIGICQEYRPIYQKYDEKCNVDGDCLGNLICPESTKKCGLPGKDKSPYIVIDPISKEKNYLTEIFRIIKNKMNNGIIVFSIDNYQHVENYRIIAKLQKVINKPIENFLIFLNKIDKSENSEVDLSILTNKIS